MANQLRKVPTESAAAAAALKARIDAQGGVKVAPPSVPPGSDLDTVVDDRRDAPAPGTITPPAEPVTLDAFAKVAGTSAAAAADLEAAAQRRLDPAFAAIIEEGKPRTEPGRDFAEEATQDPRDRDEGTLNPREDRDKYEDDAPQTGFDTWVFADFRQSRRNAAAGEVLTGPDVSSPSDGGPEEHPGGPSKGGEGSLDGGGSGTEDGGGAGTSFGGQPFAGAPRFGTVADLGAGGTDYAQFANEGALTAARLGELGTGGEEMDAMMGLLNEKASVQGDTSPGVEADVTQVVRLLAPRNLEALTRGALGPLPSAFLAGVTVGTAIEEYSEKDDKLVEAVFGDPHEDAKDEEEAAAYIQKLAAAGDTEGIKRYAAAMRAAGRLDQPSTTPSAKDPGADPDSVGGGRPTTAEWNYFLWMKESTGRGLGPTGGDVDPADANTSGLPQGGSAPVDVVSMIGQPVAGEERAGISPRGSFNPNLLGGDRGNVDPAEGDDTGPWTSNQHTEDEGDVFAGTPTLGIGALDRDDDEEEEDDDQDDDGV